MIARVQNNIFFQKKFKKNLIYKKCFFLVFIFTINLESFKNSYISPKLILMGIFLLSSTSSTKLCEKIIFLSTHTQNTKNGL